MRPARTIVLALVAIGILTVAVFGIRAVTNKPAAKTVEKIPARGALVESSNPADARVRAAQAMIERAGGKPDGYNLLGDAFMQKARETGDFSFNARADAALQKSLELAPDNYSTLVLRAKLLLSLHRFREALEVARRAQAMRPQEYHAYGALTDAYVELGDYDAAIEAAQKRMDLRPDMDAYARVSYLRSLHGDTEGAIEAMQVAAKAADPRDFESVAWCRVHLGDELMSAGKLAPAEKEYDNALAVFPDYYLALAAKARARVAAGDMNGAIDFYKRAQDRVPLPDTAIALGDLYTKLGRADDAKKQYDLVEFIERGGTAGSETYSRQLALFYADHDIKLDEALDIARRERAARTDIYTSDALAWCLFKKGQFAEAKTAMDEALRLGTNDARLFYHAGMIANALGDRRGATKYLGQAVKINPSFDVLQSGAARETLAKIKV
ncbi:MAG TPA: tetratricopeptide repeat protein [Pyrinomonadaceae bacterium]|nr:tetratricopeptide repeat protein [Pyrinomonadaceae bacterium]